MKKIILGAALLIAGALAILTPIMVTIQESPE